MQPRRKQGIVKLYVYLINSSYEEGPDEAPTEESIRISIRLRRKDTPKGFVWLYETTRRRDFRTFE